MVFLITAFPTTIHTRKMTGNNILISDVQHGTTKPQKVKNRRYRKFLDRNEIDLIEPKELADILDHVSGDNEIQGRAMIIAAYLTGARPNEYLRIKAKHIVKKGNYLIIDLKPSKNGLPRKFHVSLKKKSTRKFLDELYSYSHSLHPEAYIFNDFIAKRYQYYKPKKGDIKRYIRITDKLNYWFKKWFKDLPEPINPYILRHNRWSSMAEKGAPLEIIRQLKGSKDMRSVFPYLHMSSKMAKSGAKYLD